MSVNYLQKTTTLACPECGSTDIVFPANAGWDSQNTKFVISSVTDDNRWCLECDVEFDEAISNYHIHPKVNAINYVKGDATKPFTQPGLNAIAHVCNDIGVWGGGCVVPLAKAFPEAKDTYLAAWSDLFLGQVQAVTTSDALVNCPTETPVHTIYNMVAQAGVKSRDNPHPLDYGILNNCVEKVAIHMQASAQLGQSKTLHIPRFGCDRVGGKWGFVEPIVALLNTYGITVLVYDLP